MSTDTILSQVCILNCFGKDGVGTVEWVLGRDLFIAGFNVIHICVSSMIMCHETSISKSQFLITNGKYARYYKINAAIGITV